MNTTAQKNRDRGVAPVAAKEVSRRQRDSFISKSRQSKSTIYGCPAALGCRTAGELLRAWCRIDPHTTLHLGDAYRHVCAAKCDARPCCRDRDGGES